METYFHYGSMHHDKKPLQRSTCDSGELLKKYSSKTVSAGGMHDCNQLQPATITVHIWNWNEIVYLIFPAQT